MLQTLTTTGGKGGVYAGVNDPKRG
jgi:hypothetical protein